MGCVVVEAERDGSTAYQEYLARQRHHDLVSLDDHWGEAYLLGFDTGEGRFVATRRDNGEEIREETADGLRTAIRLDYGEKPVPRNVPGGVV